MKSILMTALVMLALPAQAADPKAGPAASGKGGEVVTIYTSAQGARQQMARSQAAPLKAGHPLNEGENSVFVDPGMRFQSLLGIGGAITDATAETFAKLEPARQEELLRAYYDGYARVAAEAEAK